MSLRDWLTFGLHPKSLGQRGEDAAAKFLKRQRYHIIARHHDSPLGEIDIIAVDNRTVVFVEVKTRSSTDAGHPTEAIDDRKQQRMTRAALAYLKLHGLLQHASRFDVVAVLYDADACRPTIEHYKNAFEAAGIGQFYR